MSEETVNLVARWRAGDEQAAAELFRRYAERLIGLARQRISGIAARTDPEDVVQSVFRSFFVGARGGRFVLQKSGDLWRLLAAITLHKVRRQIEYHTAAKRLVSREKNGRPEDSFHGIPVEVMAREPSPADAVILSETLERIMGQLNVAQRSVVEMRLQGHTVVEIVAATQRSRASIRRILDRVQRWLAKEQSDHPEAI